MTAVVFVMVSVAVVMMMMTLPPLDDVYEMLLCLMFLMIKLHAGFMQLLSSMA